MYKLIASDLDETLLNSEKHVSIEDVQAIKSLKDCKFIIATGRGFFSVKQTLQEIGQYNSKDDYVISYNGGLIKKTDGTTISTTSLKFLEAEYLFKLGLQYPDICVQVCCPDNVYAYNITQDEIDYVKGTLKYDLFDTRNIDFLKDTPIMKILFNLPDMDRLRYIRKQVNLEDKFAVSFSAGRYIEFNPIGVDKGYGLKKIAEILNIDIKDTIALGDNTNDLPMIQAAGLGVGVSNVIEDMKKDCDYILKTDNNHSPIKELIDTFIKRTGKEDDPYVYAKTKIHMYHGDGLSVSIKCKNNILDDIIDIFGIDAKVYPIDGDYFEAIVKSSKEGMMYLALQYARFMEVLEPKDLREDIKKILKETIEKYK